MYSPVELQQRIKGFVTALESLPAVGGAERGERIRQVLLKAANQTRVGYRDACASGSPDEFIRRISFVVTTAKRAKAALVLLVHLDYVVMERVRDVIIEARAIENILTASRNSGKRRQQRRLVSEKTRVARSHHR